MADISAQAVKDLREKTGAGMMDCKKALNEAGGDMEKAVECLRKAGITKAEKKSGRSVKEGLVLSKVSGGVGAMIEVLCETDFVTKNDKFQAYAKEALERLFASSANGDVAAKFAEQEQAAITSLIATVGENMQVRRAIRWDAKAKVTTYIHMGGRIGVMVEAAGEADDAVLADACKHIAAFNPGYIGPKDVPAAVIATEKEIAAAQVVGKPAEMVDKIVFGKINKWYTEVCLMKQPWLRDDKSCLEKIAPKLTITRFARWEVGEDIA